MTKQEVLDKFTEFAAVLRQHHLATSDVVHLFEQLREAAGNALKPSTVPQSVAVSEIVTDPIDETA